MLSQTGFNENIGNFKVLLTDGVAVAKSVGRELKKKYNIKHVIWLCHNLHNLTETVRDHLPAIRGFLGKINSKWIRGKKFREEWKKTQCLPSFPSYVITRWGKWLETAFF